MRTRRQKRTIVVLMAFLVCYFGGYVYARLTHKIERLTYHRPGGAQVLAEPDPWDDLLANMSAGNPVVSVYTHELRKTHGFLNFLFWPLRSIEAAWWNRIEGQGQRAAAIGTRRNG
jgi:hypothetical protein